MLQITGRPHVRPVIAFFVLPFGITSGLLLAFPGLVEAAFGPLSAAHPVFIPTLWSPIMSGIALVLWVGRTAMFRHEATEVMQTIPASAT